MNKLQPFVAADILLPKTQLFPNWAVIACDQFTAEPAYWAEAKRLAGENPSALHLILPEGEIAAPDIGEKIEKIHQTMADYISSGLFCRFENSMVYVERTLSTGKVRKGIVGAVDLECYEYTADSQSLVRATEGTVLDRLPPRIAVREKAALETPHILLLVDDLHSPVLPKAKALAGEMLYDTELMQGGGHITGWRLSEKPAAEIAENIANLQPKGKKNPIVVAVGDGNHSLATAKACYQRLKEEIGSKALSHPARYALAELCSIRDVSLAFEPIHRVLFGAEREKLTAFLQTQSGGDFCVTMVSEAGETPLWLAAKGAMLAVGALQNALDQYLKENSGEIDYVHGDDVAKDLGAKQNAVSFLLPPVEIDALLPSVEKDGVLPRKTFSMGHARDKRYYIECRKIV